MSKHPRLWKLFAAGRLRTSCEMQYLTNFFPHPLSACEILHLTETLKNQERFLFICLRYPGNSASGIVSWERFPILRTITLFSIASFCPIITA